MDGKTINELFKKWNKKEERTDQQASIIEDYLLNIDGKLINQGWDTTGAKTVEFGYHDQSLLNHVRNGVFFLLRLNEVAKELESRVLEPDELRNAVAMFVAHDLHKTRSTDGAKEEFDISRDYVQSFVEEVGLLEFAPGVTIDDFWSCACAHHDSLNAKPGNVTVMFDELQAYVRLADAFASSPTPEDAVSERTRRRFSDVFFGDLELRYHQLTEVKGILTNLYNTAVSNYLCDHGYNLLTIYQDGCVYAVREETPQQLVNEDIIESVYLEFTQTVRRSHPSYTNPTKLMDSIEAGHLGYYILSNQDFFYSGPERVVEALIRKAAQDGDTDNAPTESMSTGIEKAAGEVPIELDDSRQLVATARLVYSVYRTIIPALDEEEDEFQTVFDLFAVSDEVREALLKTRDENPGLLKSGGKWEYSYPIAQELLNREFDNIAAKNLSPNNFGDEVSDFLITRLASYEGWETIDEAFVEDIRRELVAHLIDILVVEGSSATAESNLSDQFDEYTGKRGGKICTLCNRGTTGNKGDMETKKSLSTLQAGFSNRVQIGAGKPEQLLMCEPCRVELSLRTVGSNRREAGRLFFHFVPDYFYTPFSWEFTNLLFARFRDDARVRMQRLANGLFEGGGEEETYRTAIESLAAGADDGGMSMLEQVNQGYTEGFGMTPMAYFKPNENDTEFQFFGVYVALAIASYSGHRVLISENPMPEIRGRDFKEVARLGAGLTPVHRFYGDVVRLTELESTLKSASALIQLGYGTERKDSLVPKYLRATRNKQLPGSYLLKRIAQNDPDEGSRVAWNLMDEAKYLDMQTGVTTTNDT